MIKKITIPIFFMLITALAFAQNRYDLKGYKLTIIDNSNIADSVIRKKINNAFLSVYPDFARADGYRTTREATLEISDGLSSNMTAEAGKIIVNSKWLKSNSSQLGNELRYQLSRKWLSVDKVEKHGFQLVFVSKDPIFDKTKNNLINTYFKVYPRLVKKFNRSLTKKCSLWWIQLTRAWQKQAEEESYLVLLT